MTQKITIDPITRLEGHGKIDIFLDAQGEVERAYFRIPELRGFEVFARGRPAEDMPQITSRICGVCPLAHHMASTKALDDLYKVTPTPAARKVRELAYSSFMLEDHALHVYILGGPDFIVGPDAPPEMRNVIGVIQTVGVEVGKPGNGDLNCGAHTGPGEISNHCTAGMPSRWPAKTVNGDSNLLASAIESGNTP